MARLDGHRVAITGQRRAEEMAELVRRLGGIPYIAPTVNLRFEEAKEEAERLAGIVLEGLDWAVFYTGVGVRAIFGAAERMGRLDSFLSELNRSKVLSRGRKALRALREIHRPPDFEASPATTEGVIARLEQVELEGKRVFIQTPGAMPRELEAFFSASQAKLEFGSPYQFLPPSDPEKVVNLIQYLISGQIQAITFTSPPAANNLFLAADEMGRADELVQSLIDRVFTASVGPVTSSAIRDHGVEPAIEAESQKMGGLLNDLAQAISMKKVSQDNRNSKLEDSLSSNTGA